MVGAKHNCNAHLVGMSLLARLHAIQRLERINMAVGKTSLMSALAGKASYGTTSGDVCINGRPDKLLRYKRVMGFVPQVRSSSLKCCLLTKVR